MKKIRTTPRKKPVQKRSDQMVKDILAGAIRVLKQKGGRHFTTIRVAEEAGISVGSLYQYFPNKDSILFEIQRQEWIETSGAVLSLLVGNTEVPPSERLTRMIVNFFRAEMEEADLRKAIAETGLVLEETKQFLSTSDRVSSGMEDFCEEFIPQVPRAQRQFLSKFAFMTLRSLAEKLTTQTQSPAEINRWAKACAHMLILFLKDQATASARIG